MRLLVDWGAICLDLAIKISMAIYGKRGVKKKKKSIWILFSCQNWPTLLFSYHLRTSRWFWNFRQFWPPFYLTFEPFLTPQSGYDPVGPKIWILNTSIWQTEYNIDWKQWGWQLLWAPFMGFKKRQNFRFFDFRHLVSHRGNGILNIENYVTIQKLGFSFRLSP